MESFKTHELNRFVTNRGMKKEDSQWYATRIQKEDAVFNTPTKFIPDIIPFLKTFYQISEGPHDIEYLDDRISYYESLLPYEIKREPPVPKSTLRRRKIEKIPNK